MSEMKFSIYDAKNMFLDGKDGEGNTLYVGTTKTEYDYKYMRPRPSGAAEDKDIPQGGEAGMPYFVEFRVTQAAANMKFVVEGAQAVRDATTGALLFEANGAPKTPQAADWKVIGQLEIAEVDEATPYRIALSDNKYKWLRAKVPTASSKASAFLMRG